MAVERVEATSEGIRNNLRRYDYNQALAEVIWNGFDAGATRVDINYTHNEIGTISQITISDNGSGIVREKLARTFRPILASQREIDPTHVSGSSSIHGKNGVGRLTFFTFAARATWDTIYSFRGKKHRFQINIDRDRLNEFAGSPASETTEATGTSVTFRGIDYITDSIFKSQVRKALVREFCWFLELNAPRNFAININGTSLDYSSTVLERHQEKHDINGYSFDIRLTVWKEGLHGESSQYYFLDESHIEIYKTTTSFNHKSDSFFHSMYVASEFCKFHFSRPRRRRFQQEDESQLTLSDEYSRTNITYKALMAKLESIIKQQRRPFLRATSADYVSELKNKRMFPKFGSNEWDEYRQRKLEIVVKEVYEFEPKLFANLNAEQTKAIIHLINLVLDTGETQQLVDILEQILQLRPEDRQHFSEVLKVSSLSGIVKTIALIQDRYAAVERIKRLVFDEELRAREVPHIQEAIQEHYWLFGEQYHLVAAAERKFEDALRRFRYEVAQDTEKIPVDHPDRLKEMDIFLVRQMPDGDTVKCVVVELKHPRIIISLKELGQIKAYMGVILEQPQFNASNIHWDFHLVGNSVHRLIKQEYESAKNHGERSLVHRAPNVKIYVKTWSEIFTEFALRHEYLRTRLKLERDELIRDDESADEIVIQLKQSSAKGPGEIVVPDAKASSASPESARNHQNA